MKQDLIFKADGTWRYTEPKNGTDYTLEELQAIVGGFIEIIHYGANHLLVVNEEGKLKGLPVNVKATNLMYGRDTIVGDVLLCFSDRVR